MLKSDTELSPSVLSELLFELASEQRIEILIKLMLQKYKMSSMAKELSATAPEIHRNFRRLEKANLINKTIDGTYELTFTGRTICLQMFVLQALSKNKKFFQTHTFGNLPEKFTLRLGVLSDAKLISGYVKVMEKWEEIYQNSTKYIKNILVEVSYSENLVKTVVSKLENNVKLYSIFGEGAVVTKERQALMKKSNLDTYFKNESLNRKMRKDIDIILVMNEKESGICFPDQNGKPDLSSIFYSSDENFHDWCLDYFDFLWKTSKTFREEKLTS